MPAIRVQGTRRFLPRITRIEKTIRDHPCQSVANNQTPCPTSQIALNSDESAPHPTPHGGPMRRILCWLLPLAFLFPSFLLAETRGVKRVEIKTQAGELVGLYEQSHALVIGVSDYTAGWPDLESVTKDVEAVSAALEGQGINYPAASSGVFFDAFEKSLAKLWPAALKNAASCGE